MSNTQHTPGPWRTGGTSFPGTDQARMNVWSPTPKGMQSGDIIAANCKPADAHLIAAAPELLAALKRSLKAMDHMGDVLNGMDAVEGRDAKIFPIWDEVRAAIAKAEGRS